MLNNWKGARATRDVAMVDQIVLLLNEGRQSFLQSLVHCDNSLYRLKPSLLHASKAFVHGRGVAVPKERLGLHVRKFLDKLTNSALKHLQKNVTSGVEFRELFHHGNAISFV